jgi:ATP-dependent protease ClpP protease subunit
MNAWIENRRRAVAREQAPRAEVVEPAIDGTVATLRLYDPIDSWGEWWGLSAKEFAEMLDALPSDVNEIRLHINSPGGEVFEAVAISNQLRRHKARTVAIVDGIAASAASFLAVTADETVMAPHSELMIHDAWGVCVGNEADMAAMAGTLGSLSDNIASMYAAKAGGEVDAWRTLMSTETWYSATEAVEAGLADRVDDASADDEDEPKNRHDLSIFAYAGRSAAPAPQPADTAGDISQQGDEQEEAQPFRAPLTHLFA